MPINTSRVLINSENNREITINMNATKLKVRCVISKGVNVENITLRSDMFKGGVFAIAPSNGFVYPPEHIIEKDPETFTAYLEVLDSLTEIPIKFNDNTFIIVYFTSLE